MPTPEETGKSSKSLMPSIGGYIAAFIALGGWSALNWQSHSDMNSKVTEFERYKTTEEGKLRERELSLEKQRISLDAIKKEFESNNTKLITEQSKLTTLSSSVLEREVHVVEAAQVVGKVALAAKEDAELNSLASQVSQLGVNLREKPPCDPDELRRYNQGKTLISQISSRARAAGLSSKFDGFVQSNSRKMFSFEEKCK